MAYTYLITGATSDVGRTLIERLLHNARPTRWFWPRAAATWPKWPSCAAGIPASCAPTT